MLDWMNEKIKLMEWYDISLVKLSAAAFALMVAKLWTPLLSLDWYWYLVIALVAAIIPIKKMFSKPPEMSM
jgi:hypothetical protein